ncbi:GDP-L-fucose synthase [Parahaliea maris]|uniref:GDP-L-fucose synthase n=1 Tax=Parahaliea maris TaxID=2716870 RepID=A0A5C8ZTR0_9GAMM|nr:GDP-L-fucose synthase [Parahaliea maris]TXS90847.1 GDP-L-fucose synthase [Parahaliea maris]
MSKRVFVAGHRGMVGSAILRQLEKDGQVELITKRRSELDLLDQAAVKTFFEDEKIDQVYLAAAKVGGIHANNTYPANFIYENLVIECNIIHSVFQAGVEKLLFLGSSCIYPREAPQPMREDALLTGPLEPTNEPYAIAKIAGIKLCESYNRQYGTDYRSVMPTNLYGPGDNFHLENSHVVPALIRRIHEANEAGDHKVVVWGTGKPLREFLHVDDMAVGCLHVMGLPLDIHMQLTSPSLSHVNLGSGKECSIAELAREISNAVDYDGEIVFDKSKPDGAPRKLMDSRLIRSSGWSPKIQLSDGILGTYQWYLAHEVE